MAKRATKKKSGDLEASVIEATLSLAAARGWHDLTMSDIAAEAGRPLADVLIPFPTKHAVINAFQDRIDGAMLAAAGPSGGDDARDRLFDILMARFDALAPHRLAMAEITKDSLCDPAAICFLPRMARTMSRILETAGIRATGIGGALRAKGLALVYADAFRVWLADDTTDMAKTMAALDRGLRRAEAAVRGLANLRRRRPPPATDENASTEAAEDRGATG